MNNTARLERGSKRTYRIRDARRDGPPVDQRRDAGAQPPRFALLSRFATGA